MTWGYVAVAGASLLGGYMSAQGARDAASTQAGAANAANQLSEAQYQQTRTDMAPWRNAGSSAISQLSYLLGLPGYAPRQTPGNNTTGQLGTLGNRTNGATLPTPGTYTPSGVSAPTPPNTSGGATAPTPGTTTPTGTPRTPTKAGGSLDPNAEATLAYGMTGGGVNQPSMNDTSNTRLNELDGNPNYLRPDVAASQYGPTYNYNATTGEWTPGDPNTQLGDYGSLSRDFSMADFQADPGYAFRLAEGQKALERSAAAGGRFLGGATLKALTRYGQGMGSQEFGNAYNRFQTNRSTRFNQLAAVAGIGQTANGQLAQLGQTNALTQGNNLMGAANASGAASIAAGNGWSSALNNGVNNWLTYEGYK